MTAAFITVQGLEKAYSAVAAGVGPRRARLGGAGGAEPPAKHSLEVLRGIDLEIRAGELVALTGPSGAGKTTFLHLLGTLDVPTRGRILFEGRDPFTLGEEGLAGFRNQTIGLVFQSHHLLPELTAVENAMMPALIRRVPRAEARRKATAMLELVGLGERLEHRPGELSGGEQQRVALARALCLEPRLLLADEPTGNLDPATAEGIHRLLVDLNRRLGITAVVVTHNEALAASMPRRLHLNQGRLA